MKYAQTNQPNQQFKKRIIDANFWGANLTSVLFKLPFASLTLLRKSECDFEFLNFEFARFVTRNKILITDLPNWRCFHRNAITALVHVETLWSLIKVNYFEVFYFKNLAALRSFWLHADSPSGMAGGIFVDQYIVHMVKITQLEDVITVDILETFLSSSLHFFCTFIPSTTVCTVPFC